MRIQFVDYCTVDYLTDHHTRAGEFLVGIFPSGQSRSEAADEMYQEFSEALAMDNIAFSPTDLGRLCLDSATRMIWAREHDDGFEDPPVLWFVLYTEGGK